MLSCLLLTVGTYSGDFSEGHSTGCALGSFFILFWGTAECTHTKLRNAKFYSSFILKSLRSSNICYLMNHGGGIMYCIIVIGCTINIWSSY